MGIEEKSEIKIIFSNENGKESILKEKIQIESKEIIDVSIMNMKELTKFFEKNIIEAKKENVLLSLHLKATMMKISDPIIFGCAVKTYFKDLFKKYEDTFKKLEINPNNGIDIIYNTNPNLAMVDSDKGITNLHLPNDIIIDASMPALIRNSGKMWGADGLEYDTKAMIPDRCYAGIYQEIIKFCKENGAFDPKTMGSVSNLGLMAKKAEEYGSHDNTFQIKEKGIVKVINTNDNSTIF